MHHYILGGGASLIYLTCAQLSMMNEYKAIYHNLWLGGLIAAALFFLIIGGLLFHKTGENEYLKREQDMNRKYWTRRQIIIHCFWKE